MAKALRYGHAVARLSERSASQLAPQQINRAVVETVAENTVDGIIAPLFFLLLGGAPFGEDVIVWWNFVARTQAEMADALADWNAAPNAGGRFGTVRAGSPAAPLGAPGLEGVRLQAGR